MVLLRSEWGKKSKNTGMFWAARVSKLPRLNQEMRIVDVRTTRKMDDRQTENQAIY